MEKLDIIDLKKTKPRDYTAFFLKRNPFPAIGVPGDTILITVDREPIIKRFQNVIAELVNNETSIITVLVGDYGSGKSHLLKIFKQEVNKQLLSRERGTLAVYIKSPGEDFRDFFLGFIEDIGRFLLTKYSEEVIREYIERNRSKVANIIIEPKLKQSFVAGNFDLSELLQQSKHLELFNWIKADLFQDIRSPDVVKAFLSLSHPDHSSKAWRWFLGGSITRGEIFETSIEDENTAYSVFRNLVDLLHVIGITSLVVLVDELEKITFIEARKRVKYQDQLRRMIDEYPKNMCMYFAIAPRQWESLTKESTALVRRLAGNWYILDEFKIDNTRELIEKYLYHARVDQFSSKVAKETFSECEPSLCPFKIESIDAIQKASKGLVSSIILLNRKLLEYISDNQKEYKYITPEMVEIVQKKERLS